MFKWLLPLLLWVAPVSAQQVTCATRLTGDSSNACASTAFVNNSIGTVVFPGLTGDVTSAAGSYATTLATVNSNIGTFGNTTNIPTFTVNAKGLITAASNQTFASMLATALGSTRGALAEYGATGWTSIIPGTSGYVLTSNGAGADPTYQAPAGLALANLDNLFINPQWQILDNTLNIANQVGPQSVSTLPSFTITGSNTGSANIQFSVSGSPNINVNDLVQLTGGGINAAISGKTMRVTAVTGNPVTAFNAYGPLAAYSPGVSQTGTGQVVNLEDLGSSAPASGQYWVKTTTLQFWPTSYPTDIDPGALRCLGIYLGSTAGTTGGSAPQSMGQTLSTALVTRLRGQTITISYRVSQRVKGGSGTSQAYLSINGTLYFGTPTAGGGSYEDVRMTYTIPTNATTITAGINFAGAAADAYYICKPQMSIAASLPANYFTEVPNDFLFSNFDTVPYSLNGASIQFPSSTDPTGVYYSLYHDPFAETNGRVHWSVTCIQFTTEGKIASPGPAFGWRNILGNAGGNQIVYGTPVYPAVASIMGTAQNRLPTDRGGQTNSIAPGFLILYSNVSAAAFTSVSMDVQGYCLN